ncbi:inositol monophosphatase family protein [Mucilaginibacter jinjuensis]|uniref:Inositol-1-monophosphatase n=1 Tax=Mucilaginibacter jinjuensis TaxID=1176721 RepID=A0ABY7T3K8_9SPHI|nr:inositol monophosphatase family protein [Mucilaginibacter jinjuensis]WCT10287.1 inositol monophosphatase family protein [Mucilaginibacter jinjuensis]
MLETITLQVIEVAKQAGAFIREERTKFNSDKIEYKGLNDLVSYVDKTAEGIIVEALEKILPEAGFLTEEKTIKRTGERYNWIIDPLDGTTNFIHGLTVFSVSIALKEYDELVAGVVYEVNLDECFYAWKGAPAYLNGKEIHVSKAPKIADSLLATGFPYYDFTKQPQYIALFTDLMQHCHGLRRLGSAATDLAYTACGRFDGYYEYNLKPWDIAAGIIIVRQAGGTVTTFIGGNDVLEKCDIVATNALIGDELVEKIGEYFVS